MECDGLSTGSELTCRWCGRVYNEGLHADDPGSQFGRVICFWNLGNGYTIAQCCFREFRDRLVKYVETVRAALANK